MEHNQNPFTPVPVRARRDGWTPGRQFAFIAALRACRCILEACRRVGMSSESAYELSRRPGAEGFRAAWRAAMAGPRPPRPPQSQVSNASGSSTSEAQWQPSDSSASSTSAPPAKLERGPIPAYSLEAFTRMVRASRPRVQQPAREKRNAGMKLAPTRPKAG